MLQLFVLAVKPSSEPVDGQRLLLYAGDPPGEPAATGELASMHINYKGSYTDVHVPVLDIYHAKSDSPTGAAVVICPGGSYGLLTYEREGIRIAQWLSRNGITGVILRYRMHPYRHPVPMMDVQRAMQTVRANADQWGLDPHRIGVLGFSAGGHLASTATVHHIDAVPEAEDAVARVSSRPDFAVLVYPVISMRPPYAHMKSRKNLLGASPSDELVDLMSTDKQVDKRTPPTLLVHSADDDAVPIANSKLFLAALKQHGIASHLLTYDTGGHGFGLGRGKGHETDAWPDACLKWLDEIGALGAD